MNDFLKYCGGNGAFSATSQQNNQSASVSVSDHNLLSIVGKWEWLVAHDNWQAKGQSQFTYQLLILIIMF